MDLVRTEAAEADVKRKGRAVEDKVSELKVSEACWRRVGQR